MVIQFNCFLVFFLIFFNQVLGEAFIEANFEDLKSN